MKSMAEWIQPQEGAEVEFWVGSMDPAGTGIRGWFRGQLFWSHDNADHYTPREVKHWKSCPGKVYTTTVRIFGLPQTLVCDGNCSKA